MVVGQKIVKNLATFTAKHLRQCHIFLKGADLNFIKHFFVEHLRATASDENHWNQIYKTTIAGCKRIINCLKILQNKNKV